MTTKACRKRLRDIEYQDGGSQVKNSGLLCAWQAINNKMMSIEILSLTYAIPAAIPFVIFLWDMFAVCRFVQEP